MIEYKQKLQELKKILVSEEDFSRVFELFFDEIACHRSFIQLGKKDKSPLLKATLKLIGKQLFNFECDVTGLQLLNIKEEKFIHGVGFLNGCVTSILYFEDIDMGMAAVNVIPGSAQMSYVRVSCMVMAENSKGIPVAPGRKTIH
jgi:hypothetical protein